ncbi:MAG: hypothetical protein AB7E52_02200 [Bdellovibrionales bacterium]
MNPAYERPQRPEERRVDLLLRVADIRDKLYENKGFAHDEMPYVQALRQHVLLIERGLQGVQTYGALADRTSVVGLFEDIFYSGEPRRAAHAQAKEKTDANKKTVELEPFPKRLMAFLMPEKALTHCCRADSRA